MPNSPVPLAGADAEFVDRGGTHQIVDGAPKRVCVIYLKPSQKWEADIK